MVQSGLLPVAASAPEIGSGHCPILANRTGSGNPSAKGFVFLPAWKLPVLQTGDAAPRFVVFFNFTGYSLEELDLFCVLLHEIKAVPFPSGAPGVCAVHVWDLFPATGDTQDTAEAPVKLLPGTQTHWLQAQSPV